MTPEQEALLQKARDSRPLAACLCFDHAAFMTGAVVPVDGGLMIP